MYPTGKMVSRLERWIGLGPETIKYTKLSNACIKWHEYDKPNKIMGLT